MIEIKNLKELGKLENENYKITIIKKKRTYVFIMSKKTNYSIYLGSDFFDKNRKTENENTLKKCGFDIKIILKGEKNES